MQPPSPVPSRQAADVLMSSSHAGMTDLCTILTLISRRYEEESRASTAARRRRMANDKLGVADREEFDDDGNVIARRPAKPRVARRRRDAMLGTQLRHGQGRADGMNGRVGGERVANHRDRRIRKGDIFLRRCLVVFLFTLIGVLKTRQYSAEYYVCWVMTYSCIFFMLPTVLPTDHTRIRVTLIVASWYMCFGAAFATRFGLRKLGQIEYCDLERWMCHFNARFWFIQALLAGYLAVSTFYSIMRRAPRAGLLRLWFDFGLYFTMTSLVGTVDFVVVYRGGKYHKPEYKVAFWGNIVTIVAQLISSRLYHSSRFRLAMWRYASTIASIRVRENNGLLTSGLASWLLPSVTLVFFVAFIANRPTAEAIRVPF